jgi:PHD/YefM family antitoxin component YafN of YafNO toxin-antitoxin module
MEITTSAEFHRKIVRYEDRALVEPVMVTRDGRERVVLISADEFKRLMRRDRRVMGLEDFTEADLEALRKVQPSAEAAAFNHELTD